MQIQIRSFVFINCCQQNLLLRFSIGTKSKLNTGIIKHFMTKRQSYFWFGLFAIGTIAFTLVQDNIRPNYHGQSELLKYFLGVAPNLFAGLGLCAFFVVMITHINSTSKNPSNSIWLNRKAHILSITISIIGLSVWEFIQTFSVRGHFDWHDLIWTVIGALTFYLLWLVINKQTKNVS
jgi:hypothetical protein